MQRALDKFRYETPTGLDVCAMLRCTARLHLSVLGQDASHGQEHVFMLCSVFRAAAIHTEKTNLDDPEDSTPECPFEECIWFEKTSFNIALQHAEQWPAKGIVDLLTHSSAIVYPRTASEYQKSQQARHKLHIAFLQAIVLFKQARSWDSANTIEDIPRTSYHARSPPETARLQCHLYENVIARYHQLKAVICNSPDTSQIEDVEPDLKSKTAALLPLAFEANLFTALTDTLSGTPLATLSLTQLIDDIPTVTNSFKTYAFFADLILSTATLGDPSETPCSPTSTRRPALLPIDHAISLLGRLITAMRSQDSSYDIVRAARWIRCVVQLVLDSRAQTRTFTIQEAAARGARGGGGEPNPSSQDDNDVGDDVPLQLQLIAPIIAEAVQLAHASVTAVEEEEQQHHRRHRHEHTLTNTNDHDDDLGEEDDQEGVALQAQDLLYPSDELQWLSTVLFNLAVDLYVQDEQGIDAQAWAARAVEVAEALALVEGLQLQEAEEGEGANVEERGTGTGNAAGNGRGSGLARLLREKARLAGWAL